MKTAIRTSEGFSVLDDPLSMIIEQEADVPCDSLKAVFAYREDFPDIKRIYLIDDDRNDIEEAVMSGDVIFSGVADEVVLDINAAGSFITVYARNLACLLTDSECYMMTYRDPSLDVIVRRHGEPFGLSCPQNSPKERKGVLTVKKGSSHYRVIQRFCKEFLGTTLRIDHRGMIIPDLYSVGKRLDFDNGGGIPFGRIRISDNRYQRISRIDVYDESGFCISVDNPGSVRGDIQRVRCLNLPESVAGTISEADRIIASSNSKGFGVQLECQGSLLNTLGHSASVNAPWCGDRELFVVRIKYINDNKGERTELKLASRGE